jgi:hypothetical protein
LNASLSINQASNIKNAEVALMSENMNPDLPYDLEEPDDEREITRALMRLSSQALSKYVNAEPDIY